MADKTPANPVLHLEQNPQTQQQTVELQPDVESCTVLCYVVLTLFIYYFAHLIRLYLCQRSTQDNDATRPINDAIAIAPLKQAPKCGLSTMEVEEEETAVDDELPSEIPSRKPESGDKDTIRAFPGDSSDLDSTPVTVCRSDLEQCPRQCSVVMTEAGHPRALVEQVTPNHRTDAQRQQPTKKRHVYDQADAALDMETHERELTLPASWTCATTNSAARDKMMEEVNERYPFSLDDEDGDDFMLQQARRTSMTAAQSYLDWQNSTSQCSQDSWNSYEDDLEDAYTARAQEAANRLLQNSGMDVFRPEFYSAQLYQGHWGTPASGDFSGELPASQLEFYINHLSHDHGDPDVPDFSTSTHVDMEMSNSEAFRPYPFLETILEETAEDLHGDSSGSDSDSCSRRSSSSSFWNDDSESGSVIFFPGGKDQADRGFTESVEADLDACLAALDAEDEEEEGEREQSSTREVVAELESVKQNDSDREFSLESSDEDDGDGRVLAEADLTCLRGMGESRSPSVTDSLIQFEALEKELDEDDEVQDDPFASLDEHSVEFHMSATSEPFHDSFLATPIGSDFVDTHIEEDCLSRSSTQTMVPGESQSWKGWANFQRPWTSLAQLENGQQQLSGDSQPRCWRSEGNLWGIHDQDDLRGLLRMRYNQSHKSPVGTSCWEYDKDSLDREAPFGAREGQDEESEWSDLVHSAKLEQPWTLRSRENPDSTIEPEPWTHSHDSLPGSRSEDDEEEVEERDPGLSSSEDSESCEEYSDSDHFEPGFAFRSLRSTLHMRSYCSYDSLNLLGHVSTVQTSVFGTNVVPKQLESVEEDSTLHAEEDLSLPEADDGESTEEQSQSSSESLDLHPSGDFENPKRKLTYQRSAEALSEDSGYGDSTRHVTPPPLDSSQHIPSSENLVTSTPRRPRPLSLEEAELFLTTENLHSPADITHANDGEKEEEEDKEDVEAERSHGDGREREVEARSGTHLHSYAMSPPTPPLWLTAWARDADCEGGETEKLMGTREEAEINEENDDEGEVAMVGLPDAKIGLGKEEQMPWHPQPSPSSHPGPAATTLLPPLCATPSTVTVCHYPSRELVVQTSLLPSPSFAREDEVIALSDSESSEDSGPETIMGTPTRVALKRYGPRSDVQVYLSKEAKLELEEDPRVTTPIGQTHKGVHFSPVVSAVNWRESYLEEPEDDYDDDSNREVQRVKVIEEEVAPLSMQKVVIQTTTRPATPVLDKVASLEEDVDVITSKDINPPGKKEFGTVNMSNEKLKKEKEKDKEPLLVRFSLARLSARMSATFQRAASSSSPAQEPSPDKEMASKKSKKDKKKEKELKKAEAQQSKSKKPEIPPKPKHLLLSKLSKQESPLIMAVDGSVIETAAAGPKEADDAVLNIGEKNEQAPPLHPGNDILHVPEVATPHLLSSNSINSALPALPSDESNTNQSPSQPQSRVLDNYNGIEEKEHTIAAKPPIPLPRGLGKPPLPPQTKPRTLYARKAYLDVNNTNHPLPANTNSTEMTLEAALEQFTNSARQDRERLARSVPDLAQVDQQSRENALHHYRVSQVVPIDRTEERESTPTPKLRSSSSSLVSASDFSSGISWSSPGGREGSSCHNDTNYAPVGVHGHRAEVLVDQARHKAREAALSRASSVETAWNATLSRTSLSQQLNGIRPEGNSSMVESFANRCRAQSLGPSGLLETSFDVRSSSTTDPDAVDSSYRVQEGEVDREEWRETNLDDIIRDLEHLSHSYFYVNRDSASPKAAPHHRRSVVGAGSSSTNSKKARSMYNLGVVDVTINAATNHTNNCTPDQDTNNMDNAGAVGVSGNRGQEWDSNRAKSMEFLLDEDNKQRIQPPENQLQKLGETRQMSEHELRIQRSLQRLNVPDWYKKYAPQASNQGDGVDGTTSTPSTGILRRREFGSATFNAGASTRSTGGWSGFQRDSKTASMTSLGSRSTTPTRVVIPTRGRTPDWRYVKSSRESLVSPASTMSSNLASPVPHDGTPTMNHGSLFNWSSGSAVAGPHPRWNSTRMSVSSGTASPGSTSTYRSSLLTSRTPYLGWRSQEKLNATESSTGYLTPSERLANSIRTPSTSALATPMSSPATRSPSRHREQQPEEAPDDVRTSIREVTSAIVHYVTESTSPQPNGHRTPQPSSPFPQETYQHLASSRSPSPRRQRCVWVESSFLGTPPPVARPLASPPSSSTPSPLPTFGAGRRTTDSAIDYGRAVVHRDMPFPAMVPVPAVHKEVPLPAKPPPVTSPTMEDIISSLLGLPSPHCALRRPTSQPVFNRNFSSNNGHESIRNEKSFSDLRSAASNGNPGQFESS